MFWAGWPLHYVLLRPTKRARIILKKPNGKVLFVKNMISAGQWQFPGGGIKNREDFNKGAARELKEELGVEIDPDQLKLVSRVDAKDYGLVFHSLVFVAEVSEYIIVRPDYHEILDVTWMSPRNPINISPHTKRLIGSWINRA